MTVEPLVPDAPAAEPAASGDSALFARALDALSATLSGATKAEDDFAYGRGALQAAVYERVRADVALSVATATAQRIAQAVQSVLNMQI